MLRPQRHSSRLEQLLTYCSPTKAPLSNGKLLSVNDFSANWFGARRQGDIMRMAVKLTSNNIRLFLAHSAKDGPDTYLRCDCSVGEPCA